MPFEIGGQVWLTTEGATYYSIPELEGGILRDISDNVLYVEFASIERWVYAHLITDVPPVPVIEIGDRVYLNEAGADAFVLPLGITGQVQSIDDVTHPPVAVIAFDGYGTFVIPFTNLTTTRSKVKFQYNPPPPVVTKSRFEYILDDEPISPVNRREQLIGEIALVRARLQKLEEELHHVD